MSPNVACISDLPVQTGVRRIYNELYSQLASNMGERVQRSESNGEPDIQ